MSDQEGDPPQRPSRDLSSGGSEEFSFVAGESPPEVQTQTLPDPMSVDEGRRYEAGPLLGSGGMGEVSLRRDAKIGRRVAHKALHSDLDTEDMRRRFVREARVQGQLEHPSVVPVYDMGKSEHGIFFTMKRVHGHTLARVLQGLEEKDPEYVVRYTPRRLLQSFVQICQAVHYAHTRGVLHRDLKPSNVMLGDLGEVYVLDWGLARILDEDPFEPGIDRPTGIPHAPVRSGSVDVSRMTTADTVVGTLAYIPPEQVLHEPVDARADVYSLGIVLYEIVTTQRFRDDVQYLRVLAEIDDGRIARPSDVLPAVDPELDAICARATAIQPDGRFASALELSTAVERVLDGARDQETRATAAGRHVARAKERLAEPTGEGRASAMQELLRAVTLDADQAEARRLLVTLLSDDGEHVPEGARAELRAADEAHRIGGAEATLLGLCAWLLPLPAIVTLFEVRSWSMFALASAPLLAAVGAAAIARYRRMLGPPATLTLAVLLSVCMVGVSFVLGPFVLVPTMGATSVMFFAIHVSRFERNVATVLLACATLVPYALDALGLVPPGFVIDGERIVLLPRMLDMPPVPTTLCLAWASATFTIFAALITGRMKDRLDRAERRNLVSAWHLRQLFAAPK